MNAKTGMSAIAALAALLVCGTVNAAVIVGGFAGNRTLNGYSIYNTASSANIQLSNSANHALYGDSIAFTAGTTAVDSTYLAGVDIFFTGLMNFNRAKLTAGEVSALGSFINGGGVVIAHGDNLSFSETVDGLLNAFGLGVNNAMDNTGTLLLNNTAPSHPVMNGPFGTVGAISIRDSAYLLPPASPGQILAQYSNGFGAIGAVDPGAGRQGGLIFFPDSETFGLTNQDFRAQAEAQRAFNNSIAWAVSVTNGTFKTVPEPGTLALLGLGLVGIGLRRRIKVS